MDFTDYEIIEKYINNELNSEELKAFENELKTNFSFNEEVLLYKNINQSLTNKYSHLKKEKDLSNTLESISNKYFTESNNDLKTETKTVSMKSYFLKFSSLAAVLVIGFFLFKPQTDLYNKYAEHSNIEVQVKGANDDILLKAAENFNNKKYAEAIPLFMEYFKAGNSDYEVQLYAGISLLEEDQFSDANEWFINVYKNSPALKNKAAWYMALTHLKKKEFSQTKMYLRDIPQTSSYFSKAKKLLNDLD